MEYRVTLQGNTIRKLTKRRRKIYDREGRSDYWKKLKKKTDKMIRRRADRYMEKQKKILTAPDAARSFYKNVRAYKSKEKPPAFDVRDLYEGKTDEQVAEELAEHFNAISSEFDPLREEDMPRAASIPLPVLLWAQVAARLRQFKKPKSCVVGDIFPCLINRVADQLAFPLTDIYNEISRTGEWPLLWKTEFVTPIPKTALPQSADDLRNISCTQLLSKVYESFVLGWLGEQVKLRRNQYGGVKGSGTEHYLIELWQKVLENIEDPRAASLLTSIDYSKAFNRLDFAHCLASLKSKGACQELINIIASFLTDRCMKVKVGNVFSQPRKVTGGVPQGSLLGVFLFNCAIDNFEAFSNDVTPYNPDDQFDLHLPPINPPAPEPVPNESNSRDYRHLAPWMHELLQVLKYVDDVINEKLNFHNVPTDPYSFRTKRAIRTQNLFQMIVHFAESQGMKVNAAKTKSLCIAELKSYIPKAFFNDGKGGQIQAGNSMKILGFEFSSDPDMAAQVNAIKRKFNSRIWILRHLSHRGFTAADLLKVYTSIILPVHDYCSCVYNSSLTLTQASVLERLQARALKAIYGYEYSYRSLLEMSGLDTLQVRRDKRSDKFVNKCMASGKYRSWFPLRPVGRLTRNQRPYMEFGARTKRLFNSPLYYMRRRLNGAGA